MGPLIASLALAPAAIGAPQAADPVARWDALIVEAALRFGIPYTWIRRVMQAESGGRTELRGRPITSPKGAMGLMQLMPATYAEMARLYGLGTDPHAPRDNILAGAAYLRLMYDRFGYPGLFAAYNAGPARYSAHLRTCAKLPAETQDYLARVAGTGAGPVVPAGKSGPATVGSGLFFALRGPREAASAVAPQSARGTIFVVLQTVESVP
jgi:soluble lytic murein transglycosylase-like protein